LFVKVHLNATSESRSGVAVAFTDLDQAAIMWADLVKRKEQEFGEMKKGEREKKNSQEALTQVRQAMTQRLAERDQGIESLHEVESESARASIRSFDMEQEGHDGREQNREGGDTDSEGRRAQGRRGKQAREWQERPGAGLLAGKRQKLAQDQDENLLRALEAQDEKAGVFYRETLTAGIEKLVGAITQAHQPQSSVSRRFDEESKEIRDMTERLTRQEEQLSALAEKQLVVQEKLEEAAAQQTMVEKKNQEQQQRMMDLLEKLVGRQE
jgi:hypothetical protein